MRYVAITLLVLAGLQAVRGGYLSVPLLVVLAAGGGVGAILLRKL